MPSLPSTSQLSKAYHTKDMAACHSNAHPSSAQLSPTHRACHGTARRSTAQHCPAEHSPSFHTQRRAARHSPMGTPATQVVRRLKKAKHSTSFRALSCAALTHGHACHPRHPQRVVHREDVLAGGDVVVPPHLQRAARGYHNGGSRHGRGLGGRAEGKDARGRKVTVELLHASEERERAAKNGSMMYTWARGEGRRQQRVQTRIAMRAGRNNDALL